MDSSPVPFVSSDDAGRMSLASLKELHVTGADADAENIHYWRKSQRAMKRRRAVDAGTQWKSMRPGIWNRRNFCGGWALGMLGAVSSIAIFQTLQGSELAIFPAAHAYELYTFRANQDFLYDEGDDNIADLILYDDTYVSGDMTYSNEKVAGVSNRDSANTRPSLPLPRPRPTRRPTIRPPPTSSPTPEPTVPEPYTFKVDMTPFEISLTSMDINQLTIFNLFSDKHINDVWLAQKLAMLNEEDAFGLDQAFVEIAFETDILSYMAVGSEKGRLDEDILAPGDWLASVETEEAYSNPAQAPTRRGEKNKKKIPTFQPSFEPTFEPTSEPNKRKQKEGKKEKGGKVNKKDKRPSSSPTFYPTSEPTYEPTYEPTRRKKNKGKQKNNSEAEDELTEDHIVVTVEVKKAKGKIKNQEEVQGPGDVRRRELYSASTTILFQKKTAYVTVKGKHIMKHRSKIIPTQDELEAAVKTVFGKRSTYLISELQDYDYGSFSDLSQVSFENFAFPGNRASSTIAAATKGQKGGPRGKVGSGRSAGAVFGTVFGWTLAACAVLFAMAYIQRKKASAASAPSPKTKNGLETFSEKMKLSAKADERSRMVGMSPISPSRSEFRADTFLGDQYDEAMFQYEVDSYISSLGLGGVSFDEGPGWGENERGAVENGRRRVRFEHDQPQHNENYPGTPRRSNVLPRTGLPPVLEDTDLDVMSGLTP